MRWFAIALTMVGLSACSQQFKPPSAMTVAELEADLAKRREWAEVKLRPSGQGSYIGTAKTKAGETLNLTVTCTVDTLQARWEDADGSASGEFGHKIPREMVGNY